MIDGEKTELLTFGVFVLMTETTYPMCLINTLDHHQCMGYATAAFN